MQRIHADKKLLMILPVLLVIYIVTGCSKDIMIKDAVYISPSFPMFGKIPQRDFYIPQNLGDSLLLLWSEEINGSFSNTSITFFGDYLFVPDLSGRVYALNINTGKINGSLKYKGAVTPAPLLHEFKLIFSVAELKENKSVLHIYDFHQGKDLDEIEIEGIIKAEFIKLDDSFIFLTEDGKVYRYSFSGNPKWEFESETYVHSSPAFSDDVIIFGNDNGEVLALDAKTGLLKYRKKFTAAFEAGFTISGNRFFTGDNQGNIICADLNSGSKIWEFNSGSKITMFPVVSNEYLYVGNLDGSYFKLSKDNGNLVWKIKTNGILNTTPLVFNDYTVLPDFNKKVYFVDNAYGTFHKTMEFDSRTKLSPVFYSRKNEDGSPNNIIVLGIDNGKLMAYEVVN